MSTLDDLLSDLTSGDEDRAESAVPELVNFGVDVIPALMNLTRSTNVDQRWWALRVLVQSPHASTDSLIPFLNDPAAEARQCVALGLASRPDESAIQPLVRALTDSDSMVSTLAANALIKIGNAAVPALIDIVQNENQSARIQALRALAEIRDHRAIQVMMKVMDEDSALLQYWAKEGLERLGLNMVYLKPE